MDTNKGTSTQAVILWAVTGLVAMNLAAAVYFMTSRPGKQVAEMAKVDSEQTTAIRAREAAVAKERDERIARRRVSETAAGSKNSDHSGTSHAAAPAAPAAEAPKTAAAPAPAAPAAAAPAGTTAAAPKVSVASGTGPSILGNVVLKGTPPPEREITPLAKDKNCGPLLTEPPKTRNFVVGAGGGLANTFVYIKSGLEGKDFPVPTSAVEIDQKACIYLPYMIGARAGQQVAFLNSDAFMHNVNFAKSKAGNPTFNFAQASAGTRTVKSFPNAEVFATVQCNVHPWMFGYIGVVSHPFFAVTDAAGKFELPANLPPGDYVLEAIHLKAGKVTAPIKIGAGQQATVAFELAVP